MGYRSELEEVTTFHIWTAETEAFTGGMLCTRVFTVCQSYYGGHRRGSSFYLEM